MRAESRAVLVAYAGMCACLALGAELGLLVAESEYSHQQRHGEWRGGAVFEELLQPPFAPYWEGCVVPAFPLNVLVNVSMSLTNWSAHGVQEELTVSQTFDVGNVSEHTAAYSESRTQPVVYAWVLGDGLEWYVCGYSTVQSNGTFSGVW